MCDAKATWAKLQEMKIEALDAHDWDAAIYLQNEQIMKKLTDILFAIKERNV